MLIQYIDFNFSFLLLTGWPQSPPKCHCNEASVANHVGYTADVSHGRDSGWLFGHRWCWGTGCVLLVETTQPAKGRLWWQPGTLVHSWRRWWPHSSSVDARLPTRWFHTGILAACAGHRSVLPADRCWGRRAAGTTERAAGNSPVRSETCRHRCHLYNQYTKIDDEKQHLIIVISWVIRSQMWVEGLSSITLTAGHTKHGWVWRKCRDGDGQSVSSVLQADGILHNLLCPLSIRSYNHNTHDCIFSLTILHRTNNFLTFHRFTFIYKKLTKTFTFQKTLTEINQLIYSI